MNRFTYMKRKYPTILVLGIVSLFTDIASEMLYPVTPLFLTTVIGSSMFNVGLIEGLAEGISSLLKTYAGFWSDKIRKRKPFMIFGYAISALSRPMIGLSMTSFQVLGARSMDRFGKGMRGAPRDAMIADLVEAQDRGLAFGWHRGLDTLGAVIGPLIALIFINYFDNLREIFYWSLIPGLLSVMLIFFVQEPKRAQTETKSKIDLSWKGMSADFKLFIFGWSAFCLTNSSDAFLILKMKESGLDLSTIIILYAFYNFIYAFFGPTMGDLSDRFGSQKIMIFGLIAYIMAYLGFSMASNVYLYGIWLGIYGLFMAATAGNSVAYASTLVQKEKRGTALGFLGTSTGIGQIAASLMAGYLWDTYGSRVALIFSCIGSLIYLVLLLFFFKFKKVSEEI